MAAFDFPSNPAPNQIVTHPDGRRWQWVGDSHWVALGDDIPIGPGPGGGPTTMPIAFAFSGKPAQSSVINVPITVAATIAPNLAGSSAYRGVAQTSSRTFNLNRLRAGASTTVGLVMFQSNGNVILAGDGGDLAPGDVLQMAVPSQAQDATLADVGITIQAVRA